MMDNYLKFPNGLIKQEKLLYRKIDYNVDYIKKSYDSYGGLSEKMSYLRLGYLFGALSEKVDKILDVGYGNGDFLKIASGALKEAHGAEINGYPIPDKCVKVESFYAHDYDVVCFFDVLEHFDDIYEIKELKTKYIYISVPECHYFSDEWFAGWKHRKPDEHLWHFNLTSLTNFMDEIGFEKISSSNIEDSIRKPVDSNPNILTAIFKKR